MGVSKKDFTQHTYPFLLWFCGVGPFMDITYPYDPIHTSQLFAYHLAVSVVHPDALIPINLTCSAW